MKFLILSSLIISTQAMAIDFQKTTGTFEVKEEKVMGEDTVAQAAFGTFELNEKSRVPASVEVKKEPEVTELTGTFN